MPITQLHTHTYFSLFLHHRQPVLSNSVVFTPSQNVQLVPAILEQYFIDLFRDLFKGDWEHFLESTSHGKVHEANSACWPHLKFCTQNQFLWWPAAGRALMYIFQRNIVTICISYSCLLVFVLLVVDFFYKSVLVKKKNLNQCNSKYKSQSALTHCFRQTQLFQRQVLHVHDHTLHISCSGLLL